MNVRDSNLTCCLFLQAKVPQLYCTCGTCAVLLSLAMMNSLPTHQDSHNKITITEFFTDHIYKGQYELLPYVSKNAAQY